MNYPDAYSQLISERGIPMMEAFGTDDVALAADDAISAAQTLLRGEFAILGGDVFYKTPQGFELAYANWDCRPKVGEKTDAFVTRSIHETCDYIRRFSSPPEKTALFALVISQVF